MHKTRIEESILEVCERCLAYGERIEGTIRKVTRTKPGKPIIEEWILVDNYGEFIKNTREKMGFDRRQFAEKIGERESIVRRIESYQMTPNRKLIGKFEKFLKIKLTDKYENVSVKNKKKVGELTLGDIVKME